MNKSVLIFIKRLAIFVLLFFIIDRGLGYLIQDMYLKKKNGNSSVTTYAVLKTHEDLLVYGSSRAAHHYNSDILTDSTGLSCFNCGRDGANVIYYSAILPSAIERHKPKAVVLDLIANDVEISGKANRKTEVIASLLLPYLNKSKVIEKQVYEVDPSEVYKAKLSMLYSCNSLILQIFANKAGMAKQAIKGFQPLKGSKVASELPVYTEYDAVDTLSERKLEEFIQIVKSNQIPLYAVISPMYYAPFKSTPSMDSMRNILARNEIELWDYSQDTSYKKKEFFYDNGHMNSKGAERFSADIGSRIKHDLVAHNH